jgi:arabinogalactan oligomer/maltooligosaccharide transport system substrate-binding protein
MKKLLVLGLVLLVAATAVFAEGGQESAGSEEVMITLWTQEGESDGSFQFILDKVDAFMAMNPNITIEVVQKDTEALREDFQTASLAGTAPQLLWTVSDHAGPFTAANLIQPVDGLYDADAYVESVILDGKTWGVPIFVGNHLMLLYNKSIVSEAPATFEELIEFGQDFTDGENYGLVYNVTEPFWLVPFLGGYGGSVFAADGVTPTLDTRAMVNTLQFMSDLKFEYGITPAEADYGTMDTLFKEGKAAFIINGDWSLGDYEGVLGDNLGVANMPSLPGGDLPRPYTSGKYFMIANGVAGAELDAIETFINYMISDDVLLEGTALLNRLPASLSALQDSSITSNPILEGSAAQLATGTPMPTVVEMRANWDAMKPELNAVMAGSKTPAQAAADMQVAAENAIEALQ